MFRKPRDDNTNADVGRPPSPGHGPAKTPFSLAIPPNIPPPTRMAVAKSKASSKAVPLPTIGRQGLIGSAKKSTTANKLRDKGNGSIMNFFKKEDTGLFLSEGSPAVSTYEEEADFDRFNEHDVPSKRRRVSTEPDDHPPATETPPPVPRQLSASTKSGPFMEESDAEQDDLPEELDVVVKQEPVDIDTNDSGIELGRTEVNEMAAVPPLLKQETSYIPDLDQFQDFEGMDGDFDEDIYEEGDEFIEKRYMEEQARIEQMEAENGGQSLCPICSESLAAVSEQDAAVHVNNCLDGNPTPLPKPVTVKAEVEDEKPDAKVLDPRQFKPNRAPKPGQENPFTLSNPSANGASVFNKLMSGHAESRAWAEAAAAEHASRGKPAYQRTCPFYKIMDGLFICVDAFRYGAVKGCQAYFLSHFHSDHYVGLTSSWNHGPIYCSHVTANLVRQQLKVDPKYVVDLEFEQTVEVPRTKGVQVTMISANHCPGSSLYLFEKTIGKRTNGQPRMQRVLHCGDFRACRMHVTHPLLMPETRDKISGKMSEQKIDVCYLDTTYLNPKYAFPSQENVIKACADMCVSLSKITPDASDGWEQMKRQRAGEGMVKFVRRESSGISIKEEDQNTDMKVEAAPNASQQILSSASSKMNRGRLLVIVGTYSIGKERICLGIAKALNSKIYAPPSKQRIVAALEDPELDALMTNDPRAAQVHMTPLFEIRADTLDDYLKDYFPHFTRAVGFRPSGWNYRPPNSRFTDSPTVQTVLHSDNWKSTYSMRELVPQRGSTSRASCFGVPYSEHSSFRELTMFCCALRIEKIIPTVNVGSAKSRDRMKSWIERWQAERRKNGLYALPEDGSW